MAEISIGEAVGEGFSLIRRRPGAVLTWGLAQFAAAALMIALLAPFFATTFMTALHQAQAGGVAPTQDLQHMMQMQSLSYLVDLIAMFVNAVIYCAIFRAVLHPERGEFAYLRVGAPELYLAFLIIAGYFAFVIGLVVAIIPIAIVVGVLMALHAGAAAVIVGVVAGIAAMVAMVYLLLRVSLVGPMMVDDGKFHLTEAWALTRGKTASLFAVGLVVFLILIVGEIVFGLVLAAIGFGFLSSIAGGLNNLPIFFQQAPQAIFGRLAPVLAIFALAWIPLAGCALTIMGAPWARAYLNLRPQRNVAETFA